MHTTHKLVRSLGAVPTPHATATVLFAQHINPKYFSTSTELLAAVPQSSLAPHTVYELNNHLSASQTQSYLGYSIVLAFLGLWCIRYSFIKGAHTRFRRLLFHGAKSVSKRTIQ